MPLSIPVEDLLTWNDSSANKWHAFANAHPELLSLPCDIRQSGTAARLLQHIVAVELRYAQRLASEPQSDYADIPSDTPDRIFATHRRALDLLQPLLADQTFDWNKEIEFQTLSLGRLISTRRTVLLHALMHSIRHYAQLATLARQHGLPPDWQMDYLAMAARPV